MYEMNLSCEQTIRRRDVRVPALEPRDERGKTYGRNSKASNRTCEIRRLALWGASENLAMAELRTHLATERVRVGTLRLQQTCPSSIPTIMGQWL
jgi:hypothetical protein